MSDNTPHEWAGEHFCGTDTRYLYDFEPQRIHNPDIGFPVKLDTNPVPPTFCSRCLRWFDDPAQHPEGSEHRPPQKGTA